MDIVLIVGLLSLAIVKATPLVYGALCGILGERSGVINIGIEGMMLIGAFMSFMGSALFNKWTAGAFPSYVALLIGLLFGIIGSALVAALHAVLSIHYKIDQVISGTVINLLAFGITDYVANVFIDPSHLSGVGVFPVIPIPILSEIPIIGSIFFSHQPMVYLMFVLVIFLQYAIFHTPWGLRMRSVGEHPRAADTVGINVNKTRYLNVILGGVLAGLGGAILVLESVGRFQKLMTTGRGFIALAVMIFGRWSPTGAFGAALLYGFAEALGVRLQFGDINHIYALVEIVGTALFVIGVYWLLKKFVLRQQVNHSYMIILTILLAGVATLAAANFVDFPVVIIPIEFLGLLPYILTILVLTGLVRRAVAPAAIGKPYEKQ
ncbi:MAG: ABC transporter permease [Anaerolineaceae bacterium]|jgi:simple sugar transport system permease protein